MKTKLTHIAISAVNPPLMKDFYAGVFGLDLVSRFDLDPGAAGDGGGVQCGVAHAL